jgi:hypothetical protein
MTHELCYLVALACLFVSSASFAKKKEKPVLSEVVLKAQTVMVIIQPGVGEPLNNPTANSKAREEVEKALLTWGRFRLVQETANADLIIAVKPGAEKAVTPVITGGPIDKRPVTLQTAGNQTRIGAKQGQPPDGTYDPGAPSSNGRAQQSTEIGPSEDSFVVYLGGETFQPTNASLWSYRAKNALRPPNVTAVQQFHQAITEAEQAAAKKQPPQPPRPKTP